MISEKTLCSGRFYKKFEGDIYIKIIVTRIPTNLVINSRLSRFLSFLRNQKQESNYQKDGVLVMRNCFAFCLYRVAHYFKGMPNSVDLFYM